MISIVCSTRKTSAPFSSSVSPAAMIKSMMRRRCSSLGYNSLLSIPALPVMPAKGGISSHAILYHNSGGLQRRLSHFCTTSVLAVGGAVCYTDNNYGKIQKPQEEMTVKQSLSFARRLAALVLAAVMLCVAVPAAFAEDAAPRCHHHWRCKHHPYP